MKYLLILLFIFSYTISFAQEKPVFYYLKIATNDVSVKCFINGFPVYNYSGTDETANQIPVNLSLKGKNNILKVIATPLGVAATVSGGISSYTADDIVSTDDTKAGVVAFDFVVEKETTKDFNFNNERFDFSKSIASQSGSTDEKALIAYGMKILELCECPEGTNETQN